MLTLLRMVLFLIYQENTEKNDIKKIESFLNYYYSVYNKYSLLYEEDRDIDIDKIIDKTKYDKYKQDMKSELDGYITTSQTEREKIYDRYIKRIDDQIKGKYIYNKHIKKLQYDDTGMFFDGDYIFIIQKIIFEVEKIDRTAEIYNEKTEKYQGETVTHIGTEQTYEYIVLRKENKTYKIIEHMMIDPTQFSFESEYRTTF